MTKSKVKIKIKGKPNLIKFLRFYHRMVKLDILINYLYY